MYQMLHTMIRVKDLDKSIDFYVNQLGMTLFSKKDYPGGKFTLAFVGYEENGYKIELTYNWEREDSYDVGTGFGHIALGVQDIYTLCSKLKEKEVEVIRDPGPMKHGTTVIAFIKDPDGYMIEMIEH